METNVDHNIVGATQVTDASVGFHPKVLSVHKLTEVIKGGSGFADDDGAFQNEG
jgi:hypothetical protein